MEKLDEKSKKRYREFVNYIFGDTDSRKRAPEISWKEANYLQELFSDAIEKEFSNSWNKIGGDIWKSIFLISINYEEKKHYSLVCKSWKEWYESIEFERFKIYIYDSDMFDVLLFLVLFKSMEDGIISGVKMFFNIDKLSGSWVKWTKSKSKEIVFQFHERLIGSPEQRDCLQEYGFIEKYFNLDRLFDFQDCIFSNVYEEHIYIKKSSNNSDDDTEFVFLG